MQVRHSLIAAVVVATFAAGASAAYLTDSLPSKIVTALKADQGVPHNLVTALKADEGVPHNLVTA